MTGPAVDAGNGLAGGAEIKAIVDNADRLGLTWTMREGTVTNSQVVNGKISVAFDGDQNNPIDMIPMFGPTYIGQRVYVLIVPPSGNYVVGAVWPLQIGMRARSTATTITSGSEENLAWNTVDEETAPGGVSYFVASSHLTLRIPVDGLWAVTLQGDLGGGSGGTRNFFAINVTSASLTGMPQVFRGSFGTGEDNGMAACTIPLLADDRLVMTGFQNSGTSRSCAAWLSMMRVGGYVNQP